MYYILHGEDELSRSEAVAEMRAQMGDPQFADLNISQFDGRKVTLQELEHACNVIPFLADERLVIVEGLLSRLEPHAKKGEGEDEQAIEGGATPGLTKDLAAYLERLPRTTRLVFVEPRTLAKNNLVVKQAMRANSKDASVREFLPPSKSELPTWVRERVSSKGGTIEVEAVAELTDHIGADLRLIDNEIDKLLTYRAKETIRIQDVQSLVAPVREAVVFSLVDAIGRREKRAALRLLHEQLDQGAAPAYLLTMITRQFRLLLQLKDLAARGKTMNAAREQLKLHPFAAEKMWKQMANFTLPQLQAIYLRILDVDVAIKTGRSEPILALDVLVNDLTS